MIYGTIRWTLIIAFLFINIFSSIGIAQAATPIDFGETISGSIDSFTEMDNYTFSVNPNDVILIRITKASGSFSPEFKLFAPNETMLENKYGSFFEIYRPLLDSGEYTIQISDYGSDDTGSYGIFIQRLNNPGNVVPIGFGENISASINSMAEMDTYTFSATAGDSVTIKMRSDWSYDPELRLYAPNGTLLSKVNVYYFSKITQNLPEIGEYTILAGDEQGDNTGNYEIYMQRLNNPANPTPIGFGENKSASLDSPLEMDAYTFIANAGDSVLIRARPTGSWASRIKLYFPNGTLLSQDDGSYLSEITQTLPESGEYIIIFEDYGYDSTGNYTIFIQRLNNPGNVVPIGFGENISASINSMAEMDTYTFSATAGDSVTIQMRSDWAYDPELKFYAPNGTLLSQVNGYYFCKVIQTLPDTGEYTILAGDDQGEETGNYEIYMQRLNNPANPTPIGFGENKSSSLDSPLEMDSYTFTANAGDSVLVRVRSTWYDGPEIKLYAPNGSMISQASGSSTYFSEITQSLTDSGEYTIFVGDHDSNNIGSYGIYVQRVNNPDNSIPLGFDENVSASINSTAEMDTYTFSATAGDSVTIQMRSDWAYDPELKFYAPNGTLLSQVNGYYFCKVIQTLPDTGEYTILAGDDQGEETGNYEIYMQRLNNPANPTPIGFGENKSSSLDSPLEMDSYTFTANAGDSVLVRVRSTWYDGPEIKLYAPNGSMISQASGSSTYFSEITQSLTDSGEYTIFVGDHDSNNIGSYGIYVQRVNNPDNSIPLGFDENVSASINSTAEMDTYTFSATAGDSVTIQMRSDWAYDPELKFYAPNGTLLSQVNGYYFCKVIQTLPDTGEYTILAGDDQGEETGNYEIYMQRLNNPANPTPIGFGENKSSSLDSPLEMDSYTFTANAGDSVLVRVRSTWYDGPEIKLYAPNGSMISQASGSSTYFSEITQSLTDSGEYTIFVGDHDSNNIGSYGIYVQRVNNPDNSIPLGFDENVSASINSTAEMDTYTFSATAGDSVTIQMRSDWAYDPELKFYAPNGTLLSQVNGYYFCKVIQTLPDTGEYTILAGDDQGEETGNYEIYMQRLNNPANPTPIGFGENKSSSLDSPLEMDSYTFTANAGDSVLVRVRSTWYDGPEIKLYAPNGSMISQASGSSTYFSEITQSLTDSGEYTIFVGDHDSNNIGSYGIYVQRVNNPDNSIPLGFDENVSASINSTAEMDTYTFSATAGDSVTIQMRSDWAYDPELKFYAPNGTLLSQVNGYYFCKVIQTLPDTGEYTILAGDDQGEETGNYEIYMQRLNNPANPTPIGFGENKSSSLDSPLEMDSYTFTANAGDSVLVRVRSTWYDGPEIKLYAPNGSMISQASGSSTYFSEITQSLTDSGEYTIFVGDHDSNNIGSYGIYVQRVNNPSNATPIEDGDIIFSSINSTIGMDSYVFLAGAGGRVTISVSTDWHNGPDIRLYDPDGSILTFSSGYDHAEIIEILPITGKYTILIGDSGGNDAGNYSLSFNKTVCRSLDLEEIYSGNITTGKWNLFSINVLSGENLVVTVSPNSVGALELYGSFGQAPTEDIYDLVAKNTNVFGNYELVISPTEGGTYYFGVYGRDADIPVNFTFMASLGDRYVSDIYPRKLLNYSREIVHIYGINFTSGMDVELRNESLSTIQAETVVFSSPTMLIALFNLSNAPIEVYDIAVSWPDSYEKVIESVVEIEAVPKGVLEVSDFEILGGGLLTYNVEIPEGTNNLFLTLQKTNLVSYGNSWYGKLSLKYYGEEIAYKTGSHDYLLHIVNPDPGLYTIEIEANQAGTGKLFVRNSLPELPFGEWIVDTIYTSYGSVWYQVMVPPDQDTLYFEAEGMGFWSHFDIYYNEFGSSYHWRSPDAHDDRRTSIEIPNPDPGLYIVEFLDSAMIYTYSHYSENQARDILLKADTTYNVEIPPNYLPTIIGVSSNSGGNTGLVTLVISGVWLDPNATVSLVRVGYEDIVANEVYSDETGLTVTFNLAGREPGEWNLIITNPDGLTATAPNTFMIEDGGQSELWMELVGRETIRVGRPAQYILRYGNDGDVDIPAPLFVTYTSDSYPNVSLTLQNGDFSGDLVKISGEGSTGNPGTLPPGSSYEIPVYLKSQNTDNFSLQVSTMAGDQVFEVNDLEYVLDAFCPAPGIPIVFGRSYFHGAPYIGPLGYGWVHNYDLHLEELSDGTMALLKGNGYSQFFQDNGDGTYTARRRHSTLKHELDGTFNLVDKDGTTYGFRTDLLFDHIEDLNGNRISAVYNPDNQLIELHHSNGDNFSFNYNSHGIISQFIDHVGQATTYQYSDDGILLLDVTTPDSLSTEYAYTAGDALSPVYRTTSFPTFMNTERSYRLASITYPNGVQRYFEYNGDNRLSEENINAEEEQVRYSYNIANKTTYVSDADDNTAAVQVNYFGQITRSEDPLGAINQFEYDEKLNLIRKTDPLNNTYEFRYDDQRNIVGVTNPLDHKIVMDYNLTFNKLSRLQDAMGNEITFNYDGNGNLLSTTYPDSSTESVEYDAPGIPVMVTTRRGDEIYYTYDKRGQLTRKEYPDDFWVAYSYDDTGNMISATDESGTITMNYNARDQILRIVYPSGYFLNYTYDYAGRLIQRVDQDGFTVNYEYGAASRLVRISNESNSDIVRYKYDAVGRISKKTLGSGAYTTYEYDAAGQILHLINYNSSGKILSRFDYKYDLLGNPISMNTLEGTYSYEYDSIGQLMTIIYPNGNYTSYSYDASGNRIAVVYEGEMTTYTTNNMNQYTDVGDLFYSYDLNGNLISKTEDGQIATYEYNFENKLIKVTSPEGTWEYIYDALGNRIGMVHNGVEHGYLVDPMGFGDVVAEFDGDGNLIARYIHGLGLISQIDSSNNPYYFHFNPTGHTMEITDGDGIVVNSYKYSPFGICLEKEETIQNPFGYVGEFGVLDDRNGLLFMRTRYYEPYLGRFLTPEPLLILGSNPYAYVSNRPTRFIDPTGLLLEDVFDLLIEPNIATGFGGLIGGGIGTGLGWVAGSTLGAGLGVLTGNPVITVAGYWIGGKVGAFIGGIFGGVYGGNLGEYWFPELGKLNDYPDPYEEPKYTPSPQTNEMPIKPVNSDTPEDKYGPLGFDLPNTLSGERKHFIPTDKIFYYKVDFWNKEDATAPACDVYVNDQLDANLNWSSLRFTEIGFLNWTVELEPTQYFDVYVDTRPEMDLIVNAEGIFDPDTGTINWTFRSLDPVTLEIPDDPLAGFLPPITDSGYEIGWVSFTVDPEPGLTTGTKVQNQAFVNFDGVGPFNPAPKEGPWVNTIDAAPPTSSMTAELLEGCTVQLNWTGQDDVNGSGIRDYSIYVSENGGMYSPLINTINNSAVFVGEYGHNYSFYSVARDNVGHIEDTPDEPDTTITVPSRLGDFSGDGITDAWDITYLARHIAGISGYETLHCGDFSGDGVVDAWDCTYLARVIAGIPGYNL